MFSFLGSSSLQRTFLFLCLGHFILDFFTGIWPIYKTIAGIDVQVAGLLAGVTGFLGESLQLLFGYFCDLGHRKKILLLGLVVGASILLVTFVHAFSSYFLLLLLLNIGSSAFHPAAVGYVGGLTLQHKAKTILIFTAGGMLGLACSQVVFTKVLVLFHGQATILFIPLVLIALWLFFHPFPPMAVAHKIDRKNLFQSWAPAKRSLAFLYLAQLSNYALVLSLLFLLPDLLKERAYDTWLTMGGGHLAFVLGAVLALPPIGHLCDQYGQKKIITVSLSLGISLFYLFLFSPMLPPLSSVIVLALLGGCLGTITPIIVSWGHRIVPNSPSSVTALLLGLAWCFSHLGPLCAGMLCKKFSSQTEMWSLCYLGLLLPLSLACTSSVSWREKTVSVEV